MPTIAEVYNPLIESALLNDPRAEEMLNSVGMEIFKANPSICFSVEDGITAAKTNLDYYCQYFDEATSLKVKDVYGLGSGFRALNGKKYEFV